MAAEPFHYRHSGRNMPALVTVVAVWFILIAAVLLIDAALWLMALIGAFTLPAIWELFRDTRAGLDMTDDGLTWFSGRRVGSLRWSEIDCFRLVTRLDFSVRATAILDSGRKIRLPFECTPDHKRLEAALNARGIRTERHHFSLIG